MFCESQRLYVNLTHNYCKHTNIYLSRVQKCFPSAFSVSYLRFDRFRVACALIANYKPALPSNHQSPHKQHVYTTHLRTAPTHTQHTPYVTQRNQHGYQTQCPLHISRASHTSSGRQHNHAVHKHTVSESRGLGDLGWCAKSAARSTASVAHAAHKQQYRPSTSPPSSTPSSPSPSSSRRRLLSTAQTPEGHPEFRHVPSALHQPVAIALQFGGCEEFLNC